MVVPQASIACAGAPVAVVAAAASHLSRLDRCQQRPAAAAAAAAACLQTTTTRAASSAEEAAVVPRASIACVGAPVAVVVAVAVARPVEVAGGRPG